MVPSESGAWWRRPRAQGAPGDVLSTVAERSAARFLAPQVRGHVTPDILAALAADGLRVHRIGAAAYVHGPTDHLIFGVWPRHAAGPAWAARLGRPSAGYLRRLARRDLELRHTAYARDGRGRFAFRLPWYRQPGVAAYSWEPAPPSLLEAARARAYEHNHALRLAHGLVR